MFISNIKSIFKISSVVFSSTWATERNSVSEKKQGGKRQRKRLKRRREERKREDRKREEEEERGKKMVDTEVHISKLST